jgi:hypothetical protein
VALRYQPASSLLLSSGTSISYTTVVNTLFTRVGPSAGPSLRVIRISDRPTDGPTVWTWYNRLCSAQQSRHCKTVRQKNAHIVKGVLTAGALCHDIIGTMDNPPLYTWLTVTEVSTTGSDCFSYFIAARLIIYRTRKSAIWFSECTFPQSRTVNWHCSKPYSRPIYLYSLLASIYMYHICGLGSRTSRLETVSRRTNVSSRNSLAMSRSRLGLGLEGLVHIPGKGVDGKADQSHVLNHLKMRSMLLHVRASSDRCIGKKSLLELVTLRSALPCSKNRPETIWTERRSNMPSRGWNCRRSTMTCP